MKVFISDDKGYIGSVLAAQLKEKEHEVVSVKDGDNIEDIEGAQVVLLDLVHDNDTTVAALNWLGSAEFEEDVTVIGISTVLTWNRCAGGKPLDESAYKTRKCSPEYKNVKMLETLVLSAAREGVKAQVVAAGVLYGRGEDQLETLFSSAWMCDEQGLRVVGDGANKIPTLHVADLANVVDKLIESPPEEKPYVIAIDKSTTTQKDIVQAVADGVGLGKVTDVAADDESVMLDGSASKNVLLSNLDFAPPEWLNGLEDLEWVAESGLKESVALVRDEFISARKLKPVRVFVHGAPASGKTFLGGQIAKKFYLPHIKIGEIIEEVMARDDELTAEVKKAIEEAGAGAGAKGGKKKAPAKKGGKGGKGAAPPQGPRIPASMLTKLIKAKLRAPECRNKGFVLDGYPRTLEESKLLFSPDKEPTEEGEEAEEEEEEEEDEDGEPKPEPEKDPSTFVQSVIVLDVSEETASERLKAIDEADTVEGHNDQDGFARRWARYAEVNDAEADDIQSPLAFLSTIEALEVPEALSSTPNKALAAISLHLERGGKVNNFHPTPGELAEAKANAEAEVKAKEAAKAQEEADRENQEAEEREGREEQNAVREAQVLVEDQEIVEAASLPLRRYLMGHVVPALVDGLLEVCKVQPDDAVDYLAEYLFKYSVGGEEDAREQA